MPHLKEKMQFSCLCGLYIDRGLHIAAQHMNNIIISCLPKFMHNEMNVMSFSYIITKTALSLCQPHSGTSSSISDSPIPSSITSSSSDSPLCLSITPSLFHSWLKPTCFTKRTPHRNFTSSSRTAFAGYCPERFFWATWLGFCF